MGGRWREIGKDIYSFGFPLVRSMVSGKWKAGTSGTWKQSDLLTIMEINLLSAICYRLRILLPSAVRMDLFDLFPGLVVRKRKYKLMKVLL
jgi:hypothetical protein